MVLCALLCILLCAHCCEDCCAHCFTRCAGSISKLPESQRFGIRVAVDGQKGTFANGFRQFSISHVKKMMREMLD